LVDFGLARDNDSSAACLTHTGEQLGTPAYMAPELLRPGAAGIGPEVDVWGLAVVLYEALTGSHPFAAATSEAMQSAIREREPTPLRRLNPAVPRSLATVVEVAMQKAPAGRHRNAAAFATDLELVANGEAPLCRPPGPLRRLGNAARRHPVASVAITLVITFATIAILYLDHAWRVESGLRTQVTAHAGKLRRLARELLFGAYETVRDLPGAIEVNRELATQALEYLQLLRAEAADDPGLRADVVMALLRVGDVLGNPRHANLGQSAAARSHYEEALALLSDAADPAVGRPRLLRANCLLRLGELAEGDHDAAAASRSWREALALLPVDTADGDVVELRATLELRCGEEAIWAGDGGGDRAAAVAALRAALELTESGAGNPRLARIAAAAHTALARLAIDSGDDAEATSAADAAAALLRQLPTGHEHHLSVRCLRAVIEGVRGTLEWHAGAAEDALRRLRATTAALAELGQLDPGNEQVARYRLQTCGVLSIVLIDQERHAECEELLQQAMRLVDDGAARFGADWFEEQRAATLTRLGQLRYNGQDLDQAEALMRQVVEVHRSRAAAHPGSRLIAGQLVLAELRLGWALVRSSQAEAGRETIVGAQAALTELLAADPTVVAWRKGLVTAHQQIAELAFQGNDFATANDGFAAAIAAQQQLPPGPETDRGLAILHQGRGESRLQLSRFTEACVDGETAVELLRRLGERAPQDRYVVRLLATALVTLARFRSFAKDATAQAAADEAFAVISRLEHEGGEATPKLLQTRAMAEVMQALLHHYAGRRPEAAEALQAARRTVARMPGGQQRLNGTYGQMQKLLEDRYGLSGGR
ncbi:MAG: protein kinase, partial [Planctomycetes bacterium]|nr:protein kinase [Planctomycetota bacterium]